VISDHGGSIRVRSESGRGTTFTIELPRNIEKRSAADQQRNTATRVP